MSINSRRLVMAGCLLAVFLLGGCVVPFGSAPARSTVIAPYPGAPVEVQLAAEMLSITNNTRAPIYHFIVPSELLPAIEWAPCGTPDRCSPDITIKAGETSSFRIADLLREDTRLLSVFWWQLENEGAVSSPQVEWIEVRIP